MRIESITATRSPEYVRVSFDNNTASRVPLSVVGDLGLHPHQELSDEECARLAEEAGRASARLRAVRILAASGVSERELRERLRQKGERREDADEAIRWLGELNLLDDREAARRIAEKGIAKGYGRERVRQMLREKGIARELWDEALSLLPEPEEEIDRFLSVKLGGTAPDRKELKKITDALLRRGYGWESIREGLRRYAVSVEEESF